MQDATETNVINLRRTIYLTIMSAMDFEEAGHKLLKIDLAEGQESEVVLMIIECCSQEKTYLKSAPCCLYIVQLCLSGHTVAPWPHHTACMLQAPLSHSALQRPACSAGLLSAPLSCSPAATVIAGCSLVALPRCCLQWVQLLHKQCAISGSLLSVTYNRWSGQMGRARDREGLLCSYYGLLAQRFCMLHQKWQALFEECFAKQYALIHRLETNKLRNVAKFFAHQLYNDAISWAVLSAIRLTEDETTSSSRIFVKILFQARSLASRTEPVWQDVCLARFMFLVSSAFACQRCSHPSFQL